MQSVVNRARLPIRARVNVAFALAFAVLVAIAVVSYRSAGSLVETSEWVGHTQRVLAALESLQARAATGGVDGRDRILAELAALRELTADNPPQQRRVERLEALVAADPAAAGSTVRGLIDDMRTAEEAMLSARVATASATAARTRWIIVAGSALFLLVALASIALIGREIERRRRIDRGLRASEERYRALFDRNLAAMARTRRDGTVLECNPAMVRLLGYDSREEVLGTNARDFYAEPEDRERLVSGFVPGDGVVDREVRFRRKSGEVIWVSMTFVELEDEGQPVFEALMIDVTDRKMASEQIRGLNAALARQVAELAAVNRELDAFSYSISHDLRAPLRAMQGFADALLEDYGTALDATGHDYAQRIVAASRQMDALIQDLLAYSRLVRAEIKLDRVSLETVVDEACAALELEVKERGGEIEVARPLDRVLAHRAVLGQIVTNLLSNAIKFTRADTPPRVRVRSERGPGRVRLWVEDNGIGIAPEHRERIFRAFERLHGAQQYPGTGIGLAIVQKGATRLGGAAGVDSDPGVGSRFWVELGEAEGPAA
jgi:PAS domain S-box-containing protein